MAASTTAGSAAAPQPAQADKASLVTWLCVIAGMLGAFMAVLNIQITNASLENIEGGIGTGADNGAWISTSYLIGEIVVIPLTDYFSRVFSFRRTLIVNAALFLAFSVACAFAANLTQMIVLRGFQGFTGGVLIPMAFTLILRKLPQPQQPIGMAMFAITATFAPAIGPTIGGYLTENYGWEYIFYVNLVPGAVMIGVLLMTLEREPMQLGLLRRGDWSGIVTMAIGLAALQTVLEEGNKDDWFGSPFIVRLSIVAAVFLTVFLVIEFRVREPLINLRLLARRNFGLGTLSNLCFGFVLYGSVYLMPQYLAQVQGYNAEQIGFVMAWTGFPQLVVVPFVPWLIKKLDPRLVIVAGYAIFAGSCLMLVPISRDVASDQLFWPNVIRACGQALILAPLSGIVMVGITKQEAGGASGLFNMTRNLGGAFGTALLTTIVTKREQFHSNIIGQSVTEFSEATRTRIETLTDYFMAHGVSDPATATHQAIIAVGNTVKAQATVMAYGDAFGVLAVMLIAGGLCIVFVRKGMGAGGH
ncbi:MDR family MFS transporter [Marinivivus vitaminiproducens]|uniref:MDR family MFS transporter n=1 Tax=Marinivivus vitaminiproducens TaxID=3035935 RepID=UPI002797F4FF|nr:MDR family MFS transporter [Geminicoccaceae bacterium SCSIO 64248]